MFKLENFIKMKKLLCIAVFSLAVMSSTTKEINTENKISDIIENIISIDEDSSNCGSDGNLEYIKARDRGLSHRAARAERRAFVRKCRGGTWMWLDYKFWFTE